MVVIKNLKYVNVIMSVQSAEVIVMCAFGAHFIKEVSRGQLAVFCC